MASKNTEIKKEQLGKARKDKEERMKLYLEEVKEIDKKHKLAFHPIMRTLEDGSIVPRMVVVDLIEDNNK
jgi:hypothetical protein